MTADHELADYIRDQVCCPRIHGCELNGSDECPAERVRAALSGRRSDRDLAGALELRAAIVLLRQVDNIGWPTPPAESGKTRRSIRDFLECYDAGGGLAEAYARVLLPQPPEPKESDRG